MCLVRCLHLYSARAHCKSAQLLSRYNSGPRIGKRELVACHFQWSSGSERDKCPDSKPSHDAQDQTSQVFGQFRQRTLGVVERRTKRNQPMALNWKPAGGYHLAWISKPPFFLEGIPHSTNTIPCGFLFFFLRGLPHNSQHEPTGGFLQLFVSSEDSQVSPSFPGPFP